MRSEEFEGGYESVRSPEFKSVQQQHQENYRQYSVLDNLRPNANGLGAPDLQRRLVGVGQSPTGTADSTYQQKLWLPKHLPLSQRNQQQSEA